MARGPSTTIFYQYSQGAPICNRKGNIPTFEGRRREGGVIVICWLGKPLYGSAIITQAQVESEEEKLRNTFLTMLAVELKK